MIRTFVDQGWLQLNEQVAEKHDKFVQAARCLFNAVNNGQVQADANGVSGAAFAASRNAVLSMEGISMVTLLAGIALAFVLSMSVIRSLVIFYSCAAMLMIFFRPG